MPSVSAPCTKKLRCWYLVDAEMVLDPTLTADNYHLTSRSREKALISAVGLGARVDVKVGHMSGHG